MPEVGERLLMHGGISSDRDDQMGARARTCGHALTCDDLGSVCVHLPVYTQVQFVATCVCLHYHLARALDCF